MARRFRDKDTERFANGEFVKAFSGIAAQADRRLDILWSAKTLNDLRILRSNNLEQLHGDREGPSSIRINRQYRSCFEWPDDETEPTGIEIVDYHR
jgi:toxin HigB-1